MSGLPRAAASLAKSTAFSFSEYVELATGVDEDVGVIVISVFVVKGCSGLAGSRSAGSGSAGSGSAGSGTAGSGSGSWTLLEVVFSFGVWGEIEVVVFLSLGRGPRFGAGIKMLGTVVVLSPFFPLVLAIRECSKKSKNRGPFISKILALGVVLVDIVKRRN